MHLLINIGETLARFGRMDCVINNGGIGEVCPIDRLDLAAFQRTIRANMTSAFMVSPAAWPHIPGWRPAHFHVVEGRPHRRRDFRRLNVSKTGRIGSRRTP
ncbi:SDR family NAD(P)-dependent oxidoreductase [Rhizobium sp. NFACC06-2]|uniref:SDR family NAD(P)-dependent oxidoreductase n=1 Tax=Rhizobium sp. NFACC06-2 TaxID=1566264 RepID=UPI00122CC905